MFLLEQNKFGHLFIYLFIFIANLHNVVDWFLNLLNVGL